MKRNNMKQVRRTVMRRKDVSNDTKIPSFLCSHDVHQSRGLHDGEARSLSLGLNYDVIFIIIIIMMMHHYYIFCCQSSAICNLQSVEQSHRASYR